jgi:HSP20 family protein
MEEVIIMELVPWRPFGEISPLRKEVDDLWKRFFNRAPSVATLTEEWLPSVDISETNDNFVIKAELPGLESKDVNVSISGGYPDDKRRAPSLS